MSEFTKQVENLITEEFDLDKQEKKFANEAISLLLKIELLQMKENEEKRTGRTNKSSETAEEKLLTARELAKLIKDNPEHDFLYGELKNEFKNQLDRIKNMLGRNTRESNKQKIKDLLVEYHLIESPKTKEARVRKAQVKKELTTLKEKAPKTFENTNKEVNKQINEFKTRVKQWGVKSTILIKKIRDRPIDQWVDIVENLIEVEKIGLSRDIKNKLRKEIINAENNKARAKKLEKLNRGDKNSQTRTYPLSRQPHKKRFV